MASSKQTTSKPRIWLAALAGTVSSGATICGLFWAAGSFGWARGWVYLAVVTCGQTISALYLKQRNPDVLKHRRTIGEGTKGWDKALVSLFGLTYLAVIIVGALDGARYSWAPLPLWTWPAGLVLYVASMIWVTWAMAVNAHFEKTVRIQRDRGHQVINKGPYRLIRHPGYVGAALGFPIAGAVMLGSGWAFVPACLSTACLIVRTALEDKTLRQELEGYSDYAQQVRYRLIPRLW